MTPKSLRWTSSAVAAAALLILTWLGWPRNTAIPQTPHQPPWIYGRGDARFTLVEYADLRCEYCRDYFPHLKQWIDAHPQVKWQWHHLPLDIHEPQATQSARMAECAGEFAGNEAFWKTLAELYSGLSTPSSVPSRQLESCLNSGRPEALIRAQAHAAANAGISATPTLKLIDKQTGRDLVLIGAIEGDALSSAVDLLLAAQGEDLPPRQ